VRKLQSHFSQANKDIDLILTSTDKVTKRGAKIEALEFGEAQPAVEDDAAPRKAAAVGSGQLRLRAVDDD
jgi:DNA recombination protein RmuC